MKYPLISIIIATFNSEKKLPLTLKSIKKQTYPQRKIEILVVDGDSADMTKTIAKEFGCRIIDNTKREPLFAKYFGFLKAKGEYIVYLDSDEVMENPQSLQLKYRIFKKYRGVASVIPSGYKIPHGYSPINNYINELGDPFSFFIYRLSKDARFFAKSLLKKYKRIYEDKHSTVFDFKDVRPLPFLELGTMGTMTNLKYIKDNFPGINKNLFIAPFLFYIINSKNVHIAVAKNDNILHYSSDIFYKYIKKIRSRILNNVYSTPMGNSGFSGRDRFQPFWLRFKRYLFLPYSLSVIFPLIDSITLSLTRKKAIYLIHPFLCIYTSFLIIYYYSLKMLGIKEKIKGYGL